MITPNDSLKTWALETVQKADPEFRSVFDFSGAKIELVSNSQKLMSELDDYFCEFVATDDASPEMTVFALEEAALEMDPESLQVKPPDFGKRKIKEEFFNAADGRCVRKRLTGMVFVFGEDFHLAVGPCEENPNQVINFVNSRLIQLRLHAGAVLGHASAVHWKGKSLSIAGQSGMGKSTLSLFLMNQGVDFISNDRVMVKNGENEAQVFGVPKHPRINPGTIVNNRRLRSLITEEERSEFEAMDSSALWELERKYDGIIHKCYGERKFHLSGRLNYVILLDWYRNSQECQIREIDLSQEKELLSCFMKERGLFYDPLGVSTDDPAGRSSEQDYIEALSNCQVFSFSGGIDFRRATQFCCELLDVPFNVEEV